MTSSLNATLSRQRIENLRQSNYDGMPVVYFADPKDMRELCELALRGLETPSANVPTWAEEELKDGDRICEAAGVQRTEGGRLPVQKIINAIQRRQVKPHRSGGPDVPDQPEPSFTPSATGPTIELLREARVQMGNPVPYGFAATVRLCERIDEFLLHASDSGSKQ